MDQLPLRLPEVGSGLPGLTPLSPMGSTFPGATWLGDKDFGPWRSSPWLPVPEELVG